MRSYCPYCEKTTSAAVVDAVVPHTIKGVEIAVEAKLVKCEECGNEFNSPELGQDIAEMALHAYRAKADLLTPDAIRAFRAAFDLTQQELARLLGWGIATLSRYENGAIQDEAHDRALRMIMRPEALMAEVRRNPDALSAPRRDAVLSRLRNRTYESAAYLSFIRDYRADYEPDIRSGYRAFDPDRFTAMAAHFCKEPGVPRTKLNKLLWYADFNNYRDSTVSISGARYAHLPHGPAPDNYDALLTYLTSVRDVLQCREESAGPYVWEVLVSNVAPDYALFSNRELRVLTAVAEHFKETKAGEISEVSHRESGYRATRDGEIISYEYADEMLVKLE
jgi:putative zinc finger/helix-turn-helix YgiT family protein